MSVLIDVTQTEESEDESRRGETSDDDDDDDDENEKEPTESLGQMFFEMIRADEVSAVAELLRRHGNGTDGHNRGRRKSSGPMDYRDDLGTTGLILAVEEGSKEMVDLLLSQNGPDIGDLLMYAIRAGRESVTERLLDALSPERAQLGYENSETFPPYLTPVMLAAQSGRPKIIRLLLNRGHRIQSPHEPWCRCKEVCVRRSQDENELEMVEHNLSAFRALINPAYIAQTSSDPILTALTLSHTLRQYAGAKRLYQTDYEGLDLAVRTFAVDLVSMCHNSAELGLVLTRKEGCVFFGSFPYTRLLMAVDYKQKEFVSHVYVQETLEHAWAGGWKGWRRFGTVQKCVRALYRIAELPLAAIAFVVIPLTKLGRFYSLPVNRMLSYVASYVVFLAALTIVNNWHKDRPDWWLRVVVIVYATSFAVRAINLAIVLGPRRYFRALWHVYDCVNLGLLLGVFSCWWLTMYPEGGGDGGGDGGGVAGDVSDTPVERKYLRWSDPLLVGEGLLTMATVMAYLRLLFLWQLSFTLGPIQMSVAKMTADFARMATVFGVFLMAFVVGPCRLYQYYDGMTATDSVTGYEMEQGESFVDIISTLKMLFWSVFCMVPSNTCSVVLNVSDAAGDDNETATVYQPENHYFTQAVGTGLFVTFVVVTVIVLLNLLVGLMGNTIIRVTDNLYFEWLFGRTLVYLSFSVHTEPPPPFNLLPSLPCFMDALGYLRRFVAYGVNNFIKPKRKQQKLILNSEEEYDRLTAKLIKRYFRKRWLIQP